MSDAVAADATILARLKSETSQAHASIERVMPVMRHDFGLESYVNLLKKLFGFYSAFEKNVARTPGLPDLQERARVANLEKDLLHLGTTADEIARLPRAPSQLDFSNSAEILGALYVAEGSTLGGQFITRHLQRHLQLSPPALHFFAGYGSRTGEMWKRFQSELLTRLKSEDQKTSAVRGAKKMFAELEAWLT